MGAWQGYFYVTNGWKVYPQFIPAGDQMVSKTDMTRVEGENTRLRHYLARLHRKTLCYSKSLAMLQHSLRLLIHHLKFGEVPVPFRAATVTAWFIPEISNANLFIRARIKIRSAIPTARRVP